MKQFLKFTLATIVGILVTAFVGMFLFIGMLGALAASSDKTVKTKPNSVYQLELNGQLTERSKDEPFAALFSEALGRSNFDNIGMDDVLRNIRKAKNDKNIVGIYLKDGMLLGGYASLKEIRDALVDFKSSGKFIVAYADIMSQKNYYLCSVADKIYLNPVGMLEFQGIAANTTFYKNTLDKLGIEMQVVKVGTFKSAVEPVTQTKMSDANKEQVTTFVGSIWETMLNEISASRNIPVADLNKFADEMMLLQSTEKTVEYNLVDSLVYADGMKAIIKRFAKVDTDDDNDDEDDDKIAYLTHSEMNDVSESGKTEKDKIAVIYGVGAIDMNKREGISSEDLVKTIQKVTKDEAVKAVVFRINSGGGSAYGSEQIWHALTQLKAEKPLIVSMGDYAASGGYYIASLADTILAQPNTLTGSIGVFGSFPNVSGLNNKIGLTFDGVKTNRMSDAIQPNRAFTADERNLLQGFINRTYELFVQRCADGRSMQNDSIKAIAEGRVWTGSDAKRLGLVDKLGGLQDAINIAAAKVNLEKYSVKSYPEKEDFFTTLMKDFGATVEARYIQSTIGNENYQLLKQIEYAKQFNGVYAIMPFNISMN